MFLGSARISSRRSRRTPPDSVEPVRAAVAGPPDLGFLRLDAEAWATGRAGLGRLRGDGESGQPQRRAAAPAWSDLGDWNAVWRER